MKLKTICLIGIMSLLSISNVNAAEHKTEIKLVGTAQEEFSVTVPARLSLGEEGEVVLSGCWPEGKTICVTADETVTMTKNNGDETFTVTINFDGIEGPGNNLKSNLYTAPISFTCDRTVLFGAWCGTINYNVYTKDNRNIIPTGGTYYVGVDCADTYQVGNGLDTADAVYYAGEEFSDTVNVGDVYLYEDYEYRYGYGAWSFVNWAPVEIMIETYPSRPYAADGWSVLRVESKETYSDMLSFVNNVPVKNAHFTYTTGGWLQYPILEKAPVLSTELISLYATFARCYLMEEMPDIPNGVIDMSGTFDACEGMKIAKPIPESVQIMDTTFRECYALEGIVEINAQIKSLENAEGFSVISEAFSTVDFAAQNITLTGSCPYLDEMGATGDNYCPECNGACKNNH